MDIRRRVIVSSLLASVVFFVGISPIIRIAYDYITPPSQVNNLRVSIPSSDQINLKWDEPLISDIKGYKVEYSGQSYDLPRSVDNYTLYGDEVSFGTVYSIYTIDEGNNISSALQFTPADVVDELLFNSYVEIPFIVLMSLFSIVVFVVITFFSLYIVYFKFKKSTLLPVILFPAFVTIPYSLLCASTVEGVENVANKFTFSILVSVGLAVVLYISFLTMNILNTAQKVKIPLEQAAKAVQFILNLISMYIILIFAFGSYQNLIVRLLVITPFVIIYTYSSFWVSKNNSKFNLMSIKTIGISLLIFLSVIVASFWPVDISYAILLVAVIYYILLNVALEIRVKYTKTLWVEYSVLIVLLLILFLTNGSWGINFTII